MVLAGALYGNGSSRDWAAKGTLLLGVRAVIAKSFERIHRGNLVGMGVLPLQFREGEGHEELGLTGRETFSITGLADLAPREELTIAYTREDGTTGSFQALARIDGPTELRYLHNGGILPTVLRRLYQESASVAEAAGDVVLGPLVGRGGEDLLGRRRTRRGPRSARRDPCRPP